MRILHYYWTQYNDLEKPGGGVRVYLNNIINIQKEDNEIYTLNSGTDYDLSKRCYIKKIGEVDNIKQFSIFNSPMLAPSKCSFYNQDIYLNDNILKNVLCNFLEKYGPFDIVHFHSLEGLSNNIMDLKKYYTKTKFILTLHNYYLFCPQVNLWKNNKEVCENNNFGMDCVNCIKDLPNEKMVRCSYILSTYLKKIKLESYSFVLTKKIKETYNKFKYCKTLNQKNTETNYTDYKRFRERNIEKINRFFDVVICVSKRVRDIAIRMGIESEKCRVLYIGTKFAENQMQQVKYPIKKGTLRMLYMGYMRKDKGFFFFIDALEFIPKDVAKDIEVIIAAKFDDMDSVNKLKHLKKRFKNIILYNGYTHQEIPEITKNVNIGIVPVLWEDNLPQVSMEMKSMGIPVLASNRGGASELTESKNFNFIAGNRNDFIEKVLNIFNKPDILNEYYKKGMKLTTNIEHCNSLKEIYQLK